MLRSQRILLAGAIAVLGTAGVAAAVTWEDGTEPVAAPTTTSSSTTSSSSTTTRPTTTTIPPVAWPGLPADGVPRAVQTPNGLILAVLRANADGSLVARTPCGSEATVQGKPLSGATIVLDPGHGGDEPGAVGPTGLREKDVNLAVARETERRLEARGATVVLTRTGDYRITLASRRAIVNALRPALFVSIHHNADPDGPHAGPGGETYYQIASPDSKRAAGLIYEEIVRSFSSHEIAWVGDTDAGAKYRLRSDGTDYYGILHGVEVPAVLSEAAFITNPPEEVLLSDPRFQATEAAAITRAAVRFVTTNDPGSGFTEPYPRTTPAGPGGGSDGCVDPPLA